MAWAEAEGMAVTVVTTATRDDADLRKGFVITTETVQAWFQTETDALAFKLRWWGHVWPWQNG